MTLRRTLTQTLAVLALLTIFTAQAQEWPARPVKVIVPFPPGGGTDTVARPLTAKLTQLTGQQFVIDNRGGAGGLVGAEIVAKSPADGYTLLLTNPAPNINAPMMSRKPPYQPGDFAPVSFFGYTPLIVAAHPSVPAKNPKELVALLKSSPGKYTWGSSGNGSSLHIGLALFQLATGVDVVHVPYKGTAPALTDLIGGQINLMYTTKVSADGHIRGGRIRILGVASAKRSQALPDVPTLAEFGIKDAEAVTWFGMGVPKATPRAIIDKLNAASNKVLALPDVRKRLEEDGVDVQGGTPEEFDRFIKREIGQMEKLLKTGALKKE